MGSSFTTQSVIMSQHDGMREQETRRVFVSHSLTSWFRLLFTIGRACHSSSHAGGRISHMNPLQRSALLLSLVISLELPGGFVSTAEGQSAKASSPEVHLPPGFSQLTGFGERASWSPDSKKIAFMGKSFGDAFEIDLQSRLTRLLTGHFQHQGFLRVQYLPNGDYFLIGARTFADIHITRSRDQEMWVLPAQPRTQAPSP